MKFNLSRINNYLRRVNVNNSITRIDKPFLLRDLPHPERKATPHF